MQFYHFGKFQLDVAERRLCCNHEPVLLTPKQFELLLYFVEHAGCVATKNELLDAVWADAFVEESTLARNVSWLRKNSEKILMAIGLSKPCRNWAIVLRRKLRTRKTTET